MTPKPSDARRREQDAALREQRELTGLNGQQFADKVGWDQSFVSRMETGRARPTEYEVATYLGHCGTPAAKAKEILKLAKETEDGYLVRRDVLRTLVLHETTATAIYETAPLLVPGLLQIEDYTRAVIRKPGVFTDTEVESRVALRMDRQSLLSRRCQPRFTYLIYESVLRCPMGGGRVMNEQLLHLAFLADLPHITIRMIPFETCELAAIAGHISLMDFADHGPVMYLESFYAGMFVEKVEDVEHARSLTQKLAGDALDEGQSRQLLAQEASKYDGPP